MSDDSTTTTDLTGTGPQGAPGPAAGVTAAIPADLTAAFVAYLDAKAAAEKAECAAEVADSAAHVADDVRDQAHADLIALWGTYDPTFAAVSVQNSVLTVVAPAPAAPAAPVAPATTN